MTQLGLSLRSALEALCDWAITIGNASDRFVDAPAAGAG